MSLATTLVQGANLCDSTGVPVASATITFTPVLSTGERASYRFGGSPYGQATSAPVHAQVVSGGFTIELADTSATNPVNIAYSVRVRDNRTGENLLGAGYEFFQPTGTSFNFDQFIPNVAPQPSQQSGQGSQGEQGPPGEAATIAVGTVTTAISGSSASVTNSGTSSVAVFDFVIPRGADGSAGAQGIQGAKGDKGDTGSTGATGAQGVPGTAATVSIGTVTTDTAGSSAAVTNVGTNSAAVLNFSIPQGATGATGLTGAQGTKGDKGDTGATGDTGAQGIPGTAASVSIGTVTTGTPGSSASVTNTGTSSAAVLNFSIPQGATGASAGGSTLGYTMSFFGTSYSSALSVTRYLGLAGFVATSTIASQAYYTVPQTGHIKSLEFTLDINGGSGTGASFSVVLYNLSTSTALANFTLSDPSNGISTYTDQSQSIAVSKGNQLQWQITQANTGVSRVVYPHASLYIET